MNKNVLFMDIGNTTITLGFKSSRGNIAGVRKFQSQDLGACKSFIKKLKGIERIFLVSVYPELTEKLSRIFKEAFSNIEIIEAGKDVEIPIKNRYKNPSALGRDRLLNAFYVREKFGCPAVCVDVGTAVTIDLISKQGEFLGGIIFPGFKLCLEALSDKTAILPYVDIKKYRKTYGNTTEQCMILGVIKGISTLIGRVIEEYQKKYNNPLNKVITGGDVSLIDSSIKREFYHVSYLSLNALRLIYSKIFV